MSSMSIYTPFWMVVLMSITRIMLSVVHNGDPIATEKGNILRSKWISIFRSVHTVKIVTSGKRYKFSLHALLESLVNMPRKVTLRIEDRGQWVENAVTDEILAAFEATGWIIECIDCQGIVMKHCLNIL